jgi:DNA-binding XRE family transcriptional regulator
MSLRITALSRGKQDSIWEGGIENKAHSLCYEAHRLCTLVIKGELMVSGHNKKRTKVRIDFGRRVRQRRHQLELSQEALAERSGLHPTYVGSVERGERNIALENIIILAQALECSPKDLMPSS